MDNSEEQKDKPLSLEDNSSFKSAEGDSFKSADGDT
jgi:hypothetical protein